MSEPQQLGPHDVVMEQAVENLKSKGRKRVPITATHDGVKTVVGEADVWVDDDGNLQLDGHLDEPNFDSRHFTATGHIPRSS